MSIEYRIVKMRYRDLGAEVPTDHWHLSEVHFTAKGRPWTFGFWDREFLSSSNGPDEVIANMETALRQARENPVIEASSIRHEFHVEDDES